MGSSPLTRGILYIIHPAAHKVRFIPAHAGNTFPVDLLVKMVKVHPRSRGEYLYVFERFCIQAGSSPLTRGILTEAATSMGKSRFIPAHAGNTDAQVKYEKRNKVHPRSRGEYTIDYAGIAASLGSSPLTRGIPSCREIHALVDRFIPAHAGNTN